MKLILGSASPRRKEILEYFSIPFTVQTGDFDEESVLWEGDPVEYARAIALGKGERLKGAGGAVLTADTVVYKDGKVYGKPRNSEEALEILLEMAGSWHSVYTGLALHTPDEVLTDVEETRVLFNHPTDAQLRRYHEQLHCFDKAGGYAIQQAGSIIVHKIEGCYYNVMGLPINGVNKLLSQIGMDLWDHLA